MLLILASLICTKICRLSAFTCQKTSEFELLFYYSLKAPPFFEACDTFLRKTIRTSQSDQPGCKISVGLIIALMQHNLQSLCRAFDSTSPLSQVFIKLRPAKRIELSAVAYFRSQLSPTTVFRL